MSKYYTDKCFCGLKSACPLAPYNFSDQAFCFLCFFLDQVGPIIPLHLSTSVVVAQNIHRLQVNQLSENLSLPPQMWSLLCQEELTLLHWPPEICTKVVMIQLQVLDQTMKFSLLLLPLSVCSFSCLETSELAHCHLMPTWVLSLCVSWGRSNALGV